jgi:hypothetical protein
MDEEKLIKDAGSATKYFNNSKYLFNKKPAFLAFLEIILVLNCVIGDFYIFDSNSLINFLHNNTGLSQRLFKAAMDNFSHFLIATLVWTITTFPKINPYEIVSCGIIASVLDVDHFISGRTLQLANALALNKRPFLHNSLSLMGLNIFLTLVLVIFNVGRFNWCILFFVSWFTHHLRDANRHGFWLGTFYTTKPIDSFWYISILALLPLILSRLLDVKFELVNVNFFHLNIKKNIVSHIV